MINRNRAPVSNAERQREFRERNPSYYTRLRAKRQAEALAYEAKRQLPAAWTADLFRVQLMLPAPGQVSTMSYDEFMQALDAAAVGREEQLVPLERPDEQRLSARDVPASDWPLP
ncbi:MAG: hypothetical protein ACR2GY_04515 [Phycisphaerales bacterium]